MTEKELVLNYISSANKPVSISHIKTAADFQVDNRTVQRWLNSAAKQGLILITGERKARKYVSVPLKSKPTFKFLEGLPSSKQQDKYSLRSSVLTMKNDYRFLSKQLVYHFNT
jgi:pyocin large subunit-like protein